jgi:ethanolamine utilization protein EutA
MIASASVLRNCVTGRREWGSIEVLFRSEPVFTPFNGEGIDEAHLRVLLDEWLSHLPETKAEITGGAIVTGLAARKANAERVCRLVQERIGESIFAVAEDPVLESWVSYLGSCLALSRAHPDRDFLHLDVGGGTTNIAYGRNGEVLSTGCLYIGARHFCVQPGTWQLVEVSEHGRALLAKLGIDRRIGDTFTENEITAIVAWYVTTLENAVADRTENDSCAKLHTQIPFRLPAGAAPIITFSGGVGELIYASYQDNRVTPYGDLGVELAAAISRSPKLGANITTHVPAHGGRATLYGMTLHACEVSGGTLFLPKPEILPLRDVPIVARIAPDADEEACRQALSLASAVSHAACIQITQSIGNLAALQALCAKLRNELGRIAPDRPLVVLIPDNTGKTFGNLLTDWGKASQQVIVIDEAPARAARFVSIGRFQGQMVPISYYGLLE